MEAIKIGSRLAAGTQGILEQADEYFSPAAANESFARSSDDYGSEEEPSQRATEIIRADSDSDSQKVISKFADQPTDVSQGLQHAYQSLSKNIMSAANTVLAVPTEIQASEGPHGTARAVIRAVPIAVIRPLIGFSEAFANVLVGIRNTIDPDQKAQSVEVCHQPCHQPNFHMVPQALLTSSPFSEI
jgi:autophagy-related protein 2